MLNFDPRVKSSDAAQLRVTNVKTPNRIPVPYAGPECGTRHFDKKPEKILSGKMTLMHIRTRHTHADFASGRT